MRHFTSPPDRTRSTPIAKLAVNGNDTVNVNVNVIKKERYMCVFDFLKNKLVYIELIRYICVNEIRKKTIWKKYN